MSPIDIAEERKYIRQIMKIQKTRQNRTAKSKPPKVNNVTLAEFQHRILRDWVFHPSGALVRDLLAGREGILRTFLKDRLSMTDLQISRVPNLQGILLQFREPEDYTECRFVFLSTKGEEPRIFTCEAAYNLHGPAPLTMVCELVGSSTHRNFGPVANFDLETFLNRLREILEK
jgi:hypothetical protein